MLPAPPPKTSATPAGAACGRASSVMATTAAPAAAAMKPTVETVAHVFDASTASCADGGHLASRQLASASLLYEIERPPPTAPTPIPVAAIPAPIQKSAPSGRGSSRATAAGTLDGAAARRPRVSSTIDR